MWINDEKKISYETEKVLLNSNPDNEILSLVKNQVWNILDNEMIVALSNGLLEALDYTESEEMKLARADLKNIDIDLYRSLEQEHIKWKDSLVWAKSQIWMDIIYVVSLFLNWNYESSLDRIDNIFDYAEQVWIDDDKFYDLLNWLGKNISEKLKE